MNKPAYTNFTDIFDEPINDAQFIWSSNLILDNQVIVRHTVNNTLGIEEYNNGTIEIYPNPSNAIFYLQTQNYSIKNIKVYDLLGNLLTDKYSEFDEINLAHLTKGTYLIKVQTNNSIFNKKVVIN